MGFHGGQHPAGREDVRTGPMTKNRYAAPCRPGNAAYVVALRGCPLTRPRRARTPGGSGRTGAAPPARAAPPRPARRRRSPDGGEQPSTRVSREPSPPSTPARDDSSPAQTRSGGAATRTSWTSTYGRSSTAATVIGRATDVPGGRVRLAFSEREPPLRLRPPLVDVAIAGAFVAFTVAEALFTPGDAALVARPGRRAGRRPARLASDGADHGRPPRRRWSTS